MELSTEMEPTGMETNELIRYPEWQKPYQEALLEVDEQKLAERISAAHSAISKRLQAISGDSNHPAERQAIQDALTFLRVLQRDSVSR